MRRNKPSGFQISAGTSAMLTAVLGFLLLVMPGTMRNLICTIFSVVMLIYGISNISTVFTRHGMAGSASSIVIGIAALAFGVYGVFHGVALSNILNVALGVLILADSVSSIDHALTLRTFGFTIWWGYLLCAVVMIGFALSVIMNPYFYGNLIMRVIGVFLMVASVSDMLAVHYISGYDR